MPSFKDIIRSASKLLLAHQVGQQPHIKALWNKIDFQGIEQKQTENDALLSSTKTEISLYPALQDKAPAQADSIVLREFGRLVLRESGQHSQARWDKKLVLPGVKQIEAVQEKISSPDFRKSNGTYRELMESFSTAMDRLVSLNLTNALLANGITFAGSVGVVLAEWGPTSSYAARKKYHSIIPFTSAYAPAEVHRCYGCAFAEMIINKMRSVRESSTAKTLDALIRDIAEAAR